MPSLILVGAGPGIGAAVIRHCVDDGEPVGLLSRTAGSHDWLANALRLRGNRVATRTADAANDLELTVGLDALLREIGTPELVVYNAALIRADRPGDLSHAEHQHAYAINVLGALTTASHLSPAMASAGGGTIIITGGMPQPMPALTSLSLGKAGVRALSSLLAEQLGPEGIHVATVTVGGTVTPGGPFDPDDIATVYRRIHEQDEDDWETEITYTGGPEYVARTCA